MPIKRSKFPILFFQPNLNPGIPPSFLPPIPTLSRPLPAMTGSCSSPNCSNDAERECSNGNEDGKAPVVCKDSIFGTAPSEDEVTDAISSINEAFKMFKRHPEDTTKYVQDHEDSKRYGVDLAESSVTKSNSSRMLQLRNGASSALEALHLLETNVSVKRMVMSLASDRGVWAAALNNETVKELTGSTSQGWLAADKGVWAAGLADEQEGNKINHSNPVKNILSFIFSYAKGKILQLIEEIAKTIHDEFQLPNGGSTQKKRGFTEKYGGFDTEEEKGDCVEEEVKHSLFLSILVLIVVIIARVMGFRC